MTLLILMDGYLRESASHPGIRQGDSNNGRDLNINPRIKMSLVETQDSSHLWRPIMPRLFHTQSWSKRKLTVGFSADWQPSQVVETFFAHLVGPCLRKSAQEFTVGLRLPQIIFRKKPSPANSFTLSYAYMNFSM